MKSTSLFVWLFLLIHIAWAVSDINQFSDQSHYQRFQQLTSKYRCVVCQNQSLYDSNADIATDLRQQIAVRIQADQSDKQIEQYLLQRYGEFILYQPAFSYKNAVLWFSPGILLFVIMAKVLMSIKRRQRE